MKKRILLLTIASASVLFAAPANTMPDEGKKAMMSKCKIMHKKMMKKRVKKREMGSPFLIRHGLPHLTKMVMRYENDPLFNLKRDQKIVLDQIRKQTMSSLKKLKADVIKLRREIVQESISGASAESLKAKVKKLASLEADATIIHLECIEKTKKVLTKDQLLFLLANKNKMQKHAIKHKNSIPMHQNSKGTYFLLN